MSLQERIARAIKTHIWDDPDYPADEADCCAQAIIDELGLVEERMTTGASMLEQLFNVPVTVTRRYVTAWEAI